MKLFLYLGDAKTNLSTIKNGARTVGLFVFGCIAVFAMFKYLLSSMGPLVIFGCCLFVSWKLYRWGKKARA